MNELLLMRLQERIGYTFIEPERLQLALTHRSAGAINNERLEFLGDAILNFVIAEALFTRFPLAREGQLSRLRSQLVKGETLAEIAREFSLGECLVLGEGEMKSGGHRRDSILADAVEGIIGGIFQDSGFDACRLRVESWYQSRLDALTLDSPAKDSKTRLQEYMQSKRKPLPDYQVVATEGDAHAQRFTVECRIALLKTPIAATASSRREAEKMAALQVLAKLGIDE